MIEESYWYRNTTIPQLQKPVTRLLHLYTTSVMELSYFLKYVKIIWGNKISKNRWRLKN